MSDAVNKSLDDVIKERKKASGADKKKTGKNLTARKGTGRRTGKGQQGKNAGDKNKAQRVQRKTFKKPAATAGRFIRRTRAGGKAGERPQKRQIQTKDRKKPEGAAPKVEKRRLRVSNLDFNITHKDLMDLFSKFGSLTKNKIEYDDLGRSKGNAIIEYEKEESANRAIEEYDGATLDGKTLSVEIDKPVAKKVKSVQKKVISKRDVPAKQGDRRREGGRDRRDDRRDNRRGGDRRDNRRDNRGGDSRRNDRDRRGNKQGGGNQRRGGDRRNNNNNNKSNNRNRNNNRNRKPNNNKKDLAEKKSE